MSARVRPRVAVTSRYGQSPSAPGASVRATTSTKPAPSTRSTSGVGVPEGEAASGQVVRRRSLIRVALAGEHPQAQRGVDGQGPVEVGQHQREVHGRRRAGATCWPTPRRATGGGSAGRRRRPGPAGRAGWAVRASAEHRRRGVEADDGVAQHAEVVPGAAPEVEQRARRRGGRRRGPRPGPRPAPSPGPRRPRPRPRRPPASPGIEDRSSAPVDLGAGHQRRGRRRRGGGLRLGVGAVEEEVELDVAGGALGQGLPGAGAPGAGRRAPRAGRRAGPGPRPCRRARRSSRRARGARRCASCHRADGPGPEPHHVAGVQADVEEGRLVGRGGLDHAQPPAQRLRRPWPAGGACRPASGRGRWPGARSTRRPRGGGGPGTGPRPWPRRRPRPRRPARSRPAGPPSRRPSCPARPGSCRC